MKTPGTSRRAPSPRRFARAGEAVSALEYAILVGVVAVAIGAALLAFGGSINTSLQAIGADIMKLRVGNAGPVN